MGKGHADDLSIEATKRKRLNIGADELCNIMREIVRGPYGERPNYGLWQSERFVLFIRGLKIMRNWKEMLTHQLSDGDLQ
jgi:hypothetical protein